MSLSLNGCSAEKYEDATAEKDGRVIEIASMGLNFTPRCMTIVAGQTVHWVGSLGAHPLAPGNPDDPGAGSPDSPIIETTSGTGVDFTFAEPGVFPYYCEVHAYDDGKGMAGVVQVVPRGR